MKPPEFCSLTDSARGIRRCASDCWPRKSEGRAKSTGDACRTNAGVQVVSKVRPAGWGSHGQYLAAGEPPASKHIPWVVADCDLTDNISNLCEAVREGS